MDRIAAIYQFDKLAGKESLLWSTFISPRALTTFLITTVADFFTFTIIGDLIAGGTAATFVVIIGLSLTDTFEELAFKQEDGWSKEDIEGLLQDIFKKNFDKYKNLKITGKKDLDELKKQFLGD